jgi:hypothetical protein
MAVYSMLGVRAACSRYYGTVLTWSNDDGGDVVGIR